MPRNRAQDATRRDRAVARVRAAGRGLAVAAVAAAAVLSAVAQHAFRGHSGEASAATAGRRVSVAPPDQVPAIAGDPAPLQPPPAPPAAVAPAPAPAPAPPVSGGS